MSIIVHEGEKILHDIKSVDNDGGQAKDLSDY